MVEVEIPVEREPAGRFHLCSVLLAEWEEVETAYVQKRYPVDHAQMRAAKELRRVNLAAGLTKHFRFPIEVGRVKGDRLTAYCIGEAEPIRELLSYVTHLGKKRSAGRGRIERWAVETCETWDGFPVVRDGAALRHLPTDWPGLVEPIPSLARLTYPYWLWDEEELLAIPEAAWV